MAKDYYNILGVSKSSSPEEIKTAYRKLAMKYHPDKNPDDKEAEKKFKEINEAYEILKDPKKKQMYDTYGSSAFENGGQGNSGFGGHGFSGFDFNFSGGTGGFSDIFEDIFSDFMGGSRSSRQSSRQKGSDIAVETAISLEDAYNGISKTIKIKKQTVCEKCNGYGTKDGKPPNKCTVCNGMGKVRVRQGFFSVTKTCPECHGSGYKVTNPCSNCKGTGKTYEEKDIKIDIPKGIEDDVKLKLKGEGNAGSFGANSGDLYIIVNIKPHFLYKREQADLYFTVPIPLSTAALGGNIEIPTIDGKKVKVSIPKGTQNGKVLRLKGKGMPKFHGFGSGDAYMQIEIETPTNLSKDEENLLKKLQLGKEKNSPRSSEFFENIKKWSKNL